jgi:predicted acylesterase/phospholipase RssA
MGRIAETDSLAALELFRKVLLASATLPGVFAPVRIKVRVGGKDYDELHVDGGVTRQVFTARLVSDHASRRTMNGGRLYVVRNGRIDPRWEPVNDEVLSVTQRSLSTLIKSQGIGDLYRITFLISPRSIDMNKGSQRLAISSHRKRGRAHHQAEAIVLDFVNSESFAAFFFSALRILVAVLSDFSGCSSVLKALFSILLIRS